MQWSLMQAHVQGTLVRAFAGLAFPHLVCPKAYCFTYQYPVFPIIDCYGIFHISNDTAITHDSGNDDRN